MREKCFYVYKIICLCGEWKNKYYIGSHYGYTDDCYTGSGKYIKEYFKLYGKCGTYQKDIIEIGQDEDIIKDKEREIIRENIDNNFCLNIIINSTKSRVGTISSNKGKNLSAEHRKKIGDGNRGQKRNSLTTEHRQKLSNAMKGRPSPMKGKIPWNKGKRKVA